MDKFVIIIVVVFLLIAGVLFFNSKKIIDDISSNIDNPKDEKEPNISSKNLYQNENLTNSSNKKLAGNFESFGGGAGGAGEGIGGEGTSSNGSEEDPQITDIDPYIAYQANNSPCGMYYKGYGLCTGTCPQGTCTSEGKSCYCKV
jgi:hypothetical protein